MTISCIQISLEVFAVILLLYLACKRWLFCIAGTIIGTDCYQWDGSESANVDVDSFWPSRGSGPVGIIQQVACLGHTQYPLFWNCATWGCFTD